MSHTFLTQLVDVAAGRPAAGDRVLVTQGPLHTVTVGYWMPDFDNPGKINWIMNCWAGHKISEHFHPTYFVELPLDFAKQLPKVPLSDEWQAYSPGTSQSMMQDIKLRSGDTVKGCWPNTGHWQVAARRTDNDPKYFQKSIPDREVVAVRLSHLD